AVPAPTAGLAAAGLAGAYFVSNNGGKCLVSAGNGDGGARRGRAPGPDSRSSQRRLRRKLQRTGVRLSELG
ncbi:MAG: hypothetical protein JWO79_1933, partial [Actinomycetia bacterium]|nr:hypothetical protein [Actinomycetes bacterium]